MYDKVLALENYFRTNFSYDVNIHLPSGDHSSPSASVEMLVIFRGSPVSVPAAESLFELDP